ncbi:MFS transporter [Myroides injenensis]|uniref:MFS transporter n=1 Tax=Myroides injenensis TaxID=1183151 RepID=UPI002D1E3A03|nr:MFS transporter [Myroides injenensis]
MGIQSIIKKIFMFKFINHSSSKKDRKMLSVLKLSMATFIIFFQGFMVAPLLPLFSKYFQVTVKHASFIEPAYLMGYGLFTLIYAALSDRYGRYRIICFSLVLFITLTILTAFVQNINQLIVLRLFTGIGAAGVAPTTISWISDTFAYHKRGHALGIFFGCMAGGTAFGACAGALVTSLIGWRGLFILVALIGLIISIIIIKSKKAIFKGEETSVDKVSVFKTYSIILKKRRARLTYIYVVFNGMFHSGIFAWLGYFFYKNFSLNEAEIGLAMLGYGIPGLLLGPFLGRVADRYGRNIIIPIGIFISALAVFILSQNVNLVFSNALVALLSLGFDLSHPLFAAIVTTFSSRKGATTGLFAFFLFIGYGLGSLVLSLIVHIGLELSFQLFAYAAFAASICSIYVFKDEK